MRRSSVLAIVLEDLQDWVQKVAAPMTWLIYWYRRHVNENGWRERPFRAEMVEFVSPSFPGDLLGPGSAQARSWSQPENKEDDAKVFLEGGFCSKLWIDLTFGSFSPKESLKSPKFLFGGQFLKLRSDGDLGVPAEEKLVLAIVEEVDPLTLLTQVLPGQWTM